MFFFQNPSVGGKASTKEGALSTSIKLPQLNLSLNFIARCCVIASQLANDMVYFLHIILR